MFGESYAGHYVPALSAFIVDNNPTARVPINLQGAAVGNGLVDPVIQYGYYAAYAEMHGLVHAAELKLMMAATKPCQALIDTCAQTPLGLALCEEGRGDGRAATVAQLVYTAPTSLAYVFCNYAEVMPVELTGINLYDVREKCQVPPLCYDFKRLEALAKDPSFMAALGVTGHPCPPCKMFAKENTCTKLTTHPPGDGTGAECNRATEMKLVLAGDWMLHYQQDFPKVLQKYGVKRGRG